VSATATQLACDWGTTKLRAWILADDGAVVGAKDLPFGVSRLGAGEAPARLAEVRRHLEQDDLKMNHIKSESCSGNISLEPESRFRSVPSKAIRL